MSVRPYKIGFCTQCGTQVCVPDINGRMSILKSNWTQAEVELEDGHIVRVVVCKNCSENFDAEQVMENILAQGSKAFNNEESRKLVAKKRQVTNVEENGVLVERVEWVDKDLSLSKLHRVLER